MQTLQSDPLKSKHGRTGRLIGGAGCPTLLEQNPAPLLFLKITCSSFLSLAKTCSLVPCSNKTLLLFPFSNKTLSPLSLLIQNPLLHPFSNKILLLFPFSNKTSFLAQTKHCFCFASSSKTLHHFSFSNKTLLLLHF